MAYKFNPFTSNLDRVDSTSAASADSFILSCDNGVSDYDLLVLNGTNTVTNILDNTATTIPFGIFGIGKTKPTTDSIIVVTHGKIEGGFSGLTPGQQYFISILGELTLTPPSTGMLQAVGFALSATDFYVDLKPPIQRAT